MTYGIEIQQYIQTTWVPGVLCCHSMTSIPVEFIWQILHVSLRAIGQNWAHHRTCRREYIWGGGPEACPFSSPYFFFFFKLSQILHSKTLRMSFLDLISMSTKISTLFNVLDRGILYFKTKRGILTFLLKKEQYN